MSGVTRVPHFFVLSGEQIRSKTKNSKNAGGLLSVFRFYLKYGGKGFTIILGEKLDYIIFL